MLARNRRKAVYTNLAELPELTQQLLNALYQIGAKTLYRRKWVIAIDEHRVPFYGRRDTFGVTGGQKKHGTKYAFGYATAVLVHHRYRYTVGLMALNESTKPHQIVEAMLTQVALRGLKVRGVVLDSGFDSGETFLLLQKQGLAYTIPMRRKGKTTNRRNQNWDLPSGTVTTIAWKTEKQSKPVSIQALVFQVRGEKHKRVYAFAGWDDGPKRSDARRGWLARRWYRKRFGIETSYRQMRQCQAMTTTKNSRYRLLLIGLALVLRQVWVWLTARIAKAFGYCPTKWVGELTLDRMLDWLADWLKCKYKEPKEIPLSNQ